MFDQLMKNLTYATKEHDVSEETYGILAMGGTGSGKTRFSSTAEKPILVLDYDHGLKTYSSEGLVAGKDFFPYTFEKFRFREQNTPKGVKKVLLPNPNIDETLQLLAWAADQSGPFAEKCTTCDGTGTLKTGGQCEHCGGTGRGIMADVKTIVIDGFTAVSDYFLYEIMTSRLGLNYDNDKPGFDGYGQLQRALSTMTELLIKCKEHYNVIGTVLVKWEQRPGSQREGDVVATPQMDGSFRNMIAKFLDEYYLLDSQKIGTEVKYFAHTKPIPTAPYLKTRSQLPGKIDDLDFPKVKAALLKAHQERSKR